MRTCPIRNRKKRVPVPVNAVPIRPRVPACRDARGTDRLKQPAPRLCRLSQPPPSACARQRASCDQMPRTGAGEWRQGRTGDAEEGHEGQGEVVEVVGVLITEERHSQDRVCEVCTRVCVIKVCTIACALTFTRCASGSASLRGCGPKGGWLPYKCAAEYAADDALLLLLRKLT